MYMLNYDVSHHPCFNSKARHRFARVHLPVAPKCNIQCNFCNRKYDCANEGRPGVTSAILSPGQAVRYLEKVVAAEPRTSVVGIAGPGDPFAEPKLTMDTLTRVRERFPKMMLCVASNGFKLPDHVKSLAEVGVSHVTVTINAVDPKIASEIYAWVRDGNVIYRGEEAAQRLIEKQLEAVRRLKEEGIIVKVNSIIIPGINDRHIPHVAEIVARCGADLLNCIPLFPAQGSSFEGLSEPTPETVAEIRSLSSVHLPQMEHCSRCRADAVGFLGQTMDPAVHERLHTFAALPIDPGDHRPYIAVASLEGILVNQHLGEAEHFLIYEKTHSGYRFVERRPAPERGGGAERWHTMADTLKDCRAILVSAAGETPKDLLATRGIRVVEMEGLIEDGLEAVYQGLDTRRLRRRSPSGCEGCKGSGTGCG